MWRSRLWTKTEERRKKTSQPATAARDRALSVLHVFVVAGKTRPTLKWNGQVTSRVLSGSPQAVACSALIRSSGSAPVRFRYRCVADHRAPRVAGAQLDSTACCVRHSTRCAASRGSAGCVIVDAHHRQTSPESDVHDPGDRNAPVDAVLQRLLRRERHRPGRRARDVLRVPGAQRRGQVDDDQDADGTARRLPAGR